MAVKQFSDTLREIRGGLALEELATNMQQLVQAVRLTNSGGSLTIKIEVKPFERTESAMVIKDTITLKLPKSSSAGTLMFDTPEGNLSRKNPAQDDLPGLSVAKRSAQ